MRDENGFAQLVDVVKALRDPESGCPWDLEQTHESLAKYLEEETEETLEVLEKFKDTPSDKDYEELLDELGDVLLQVMLHSQLASEEDRFTIDDVINNLISKLIRRHPHVFGESDAKTIDEVEKQWEEIKKQEKSKDTK
ncbi:MAG: MazG nucleotide pyrophosphohydrolase domain-containing protein [Acidimicrobiia bacterium]